MKLSEDDDLLVRLLHQSQFNLRLHRRRFQRRKNRVVEIDSFEILFEIFASA